VQSDAKSATHGGAASLDASVSSRGVDGSHTRDVGVPIEGVRTHGVARNGVRGTLDPQSGSVKRSP
jgi:streptogramin lyase